MIDASIILFAVAAVFGLTILIRWLMKKDAAKIVIYSHGIFAVVAFGALILYSIKNPEHFPLASVLLFSLVALVGLTMFFMNMKNRKSPIYIAIIHALVAATSLILLIVFAVM
jgi:hypothetical protein